MDVRTGRIYQLDAVEAMSQEERRYLKPMEVAPTILQRKRMRVGRNDPCPCGSGKKFKRCCRQ